MIVEVVKYAEIKSFSSFICFFCQIIVQEITILDLSLIVDNYETAMISSDVKPDSLN